MKVSDTLNLAADLLEQHGWTSGPEGMIAASPSGLCLMGAIGTAAGLRGYDDNGGEFSYLEVGQCAAGIAVGEYLDKMPSLLWNWNDWPDRTAYDVVEVLRAAAVIEAARESQPAAVSS